MKPILNETQFKRAFGTKGLKTSYLSFEYMGNSQAMVKQSSENINDNKFGNLERVFLEPADKANIFPLFSTRFIYKNSDGSQHDIYEYIDLEHKKIKVFLPRKYNFIYGGYNLLLGISGNLLRVTKSGLDFLITCTNKGEDELKYEGLK